MSKKDQFAVFKDQQGQAQVAYKLVMNQEKESNFANLIAHYQKGTSKDIPLTKSEFRKLRVSMQRHAVSEDAYENALKSIQNEPVESR